MLYYVPKIISLVNNAQFINYCRQNQVAILLLFDVGDEHPASLLLAVTHLKVLIFPYKSYKYFSRYY
jgi:hypothetical protein